MNSFEFNTQLRWSNGICNEGIKKILMAQFPNSLDIEKSTTEEDRNGTDWWIVRKDLPSLSVDVKIRSRDYWEDKNRDERFDDLCLETWSVCNPTAGNYGKPGWTRDPKKRTDYILYYWQPTGRFCLLSFYPLCSVFMSKWKEWRDDYGGGIFSNGKRKPPILTQTIDRIAKKILYYTESILVPRTVVHEEMLKWSNGVVRGI